MENIMENDNYISENEIELRELWSIELDILDKVKAICKKNSIQYYAISGTLLGCVRHKGFIPWDDDIDLVMLLEDYKKFIIAATTELDFPYFFQCFTTEREMGADMSRVRRSDTTGCTQWEYDNVRYDFNRGIFIDIIPLMNVPDNKIHWMILKTRIKILHFILVGYDYYRRRKYLGMMPDSVKGTISYWLWKMTSFFTTIDSLKRHYFNVCSSVKKKQKKVGVLSSSLNPKLIWDTNIFESSVELPFEDTFISCPKGYKECLEHQYGDWRTPVKGGAKHELKIIDTRISYKDKLKDLMKH